MIGTFIAVLAALIVNELIKDKLGVIIKVVKHWVATFWKKRRAAKAVKAMEAEADRQRKKLDD